ncbi:alginate O-acetyltransferase complex protein AlgI [Symbiobacterium terraclitae]|uniref:Alginate O-acetyltransferase complex protein AlgI n=1 Tax=Symbiobacterium terraclitae TaxID=557451 RepID=A0ABS4JN75_9FIRM|nr:MBOAT family protein [Symbiobacterium terraclitae]MBP2016975.1 alginate O-acetyltransferase complex protein AlgI [Symbiobacterium terraclitae]
MLFHSPEFVLTMLAALLLYWLFPRTRIPVLAVANIVFYAASGWQYLLLFLAMSALTYWLSRAIARGVRPRLLLVAGVVANLLNLGIFKYTAFAVSNLERLLHLGLDPRLFQLVLPVGISFYTFQLLAYLVDVYRGQVPPARSLVEFWVFIAFFGQLIAGPIMRAEDFLPQVENQDRIRFQPREFKLGAFLFTIGLLKKVLLADQVAPLADSLFAQASYLGALESWIAAYLFAFQIYFDFSAYSDMALGVGHLFGLTLTPNFDTPYLAGNPPEFWRRWHITLSRWIRDYIYIPLGGSRRGEWRAAAALLTAMGLSGLWHGAAWTFVLWGLYHGLLSVGHRLWRRFVLTRFRWPLPDRAVRWASVFLMFQATTVGWVFFRAEGARIALHMVRQMLTLADLHFTRINALYLGLIVFLALLHVAEFWFRHRQAEIYDLWTRMVPSPVRALAYTAVVVLIAIVSAPRQAAFIYFRF